MLLESGADADDVNKHGFTALHYASQFSHVACVRVLLEWGANISILNNVSNDARARVCVCVCVCVYVN